MRIRSIRRFLTFGLVAAIAAGVATAAGWSYREAAHEVEEVFDAALGQTARVLQGILTRELIERSSGHLREVLTGSALERAAAAAVPVDPFGHRYEKKVAFQVRSAPDELVLRSASAPIQPLAPLERGFRYTSAGGYTWRVFTLYAEDEDLWFHVAEREDVRGELTRDIALVSVVPVAIAMPIIGITVWWIVGLGLSPLQRIARALASRAPHDTTAVPRADAPVEIDPVLRSLNDLLGRLGKAFERERRFTGDAAHELRTPLAALKVHVTNAQRAVDPAARDQSLSRIEAGARRMERLVEQLLMLNRVDEAAAPDAAEPVDLGRVCQTVAAELTDKAAERAITLECHREAPAGTLEGNAVLLEALVRNLVDNAIRYTPEGGRVTVSCMQRSGRVELTVVDTGPGIPESLRARVLERFFRVPGNEQTGSGLGLAIVQSIAEAHDGSLSLDVPPSGPGLVARVSLPSI